MNTYDITDARYSAHPSPPPGATAYGQLVNVIGTVDSRAVSIMASLSGIQSANTQGGSAGVQALLAPIMLSYAAQPLTTVWGCSVASSFGSLWRYRRDECCACWNLSTRTQAVNTCKFCGQDKKYCVGPRSCWLSREPGNQIDELEEANRKPLPPPEKIEPEYGPHEIPTKDAAGRPLDPISGKL